MINMFHQFQTWIRSIVQVKYHCIVYYKNEKICSCKNYGQAENHIKQMYDSVANNSNSVEQLHNIENLHTTETNCWKRFRNNFKIAVE